MEVLAPGSLVVSGYVNQPIGRYKVAPGTNPCILHCVDEGLRIDNVHWSWVPFRLAVAHARLETHEEDGFVIITAASDQGMVYINDRRHLVFSSKHARVWMRDNLDRKIAKELTLSCCQPTEDFECYPVGSAMGNVKTKGLLIASINN